VGRKPDVELTSFKRYFSSICTYLGLDLSVFSPCLGNMSSSWTSKQHPV
jgi:hypothetical protein